MGSFKLKLVMWFALLALLPLAVAFYGYDSLTSRSETGRDGCRAPGRTARSGGRLLGATRGRDRRGPPTRSRSGPAACAAPARRTRTGEVRRRSPHSSVRVRRRRTGCRLCRRPRAGVRLRGRARADRPATRAVARRGALTVVRPRRRAARTDRRRRRQRERARTPAGRVRLASGSAAPSTEACRRRRSLGRRGSSSRWSSGSARSTPPVAHPRNGSSPLCSRHC